MDREKMYYKLINFFKELSAVPRNSKHEDKIADYLCDFAKQRNLWYRKDEHNNVLIKKKASLGYESKNTILFQAHTDMVCVKTEDSNHDFSKDPIEIIEQDEILKAKDTSLGADDGIGVAFLMLLLDEENLKLPRIECLFTTEEEIGMNGASDFDYSDIEARYLINLDGEEENTAIVGCAGGISIEYTREDEIREYLGKRAFTLDISGLYGGHSGVDIDKGRINSNYLAARLLKEIKDIEIISWKGGTKDNAIANRTSVIFATATDNPIDYMNNIIENLDITDEDAGMLVSVHENKKKAKFMSISNKNSIDVLKLILNLKQDVIEWSKDVSGLVETSGNIGVVNISDGKIKIIESLRSSIDSKKDSVKDYNNEIAKSLGFKISEYGAYPGWKYNKNSKLEKIYIEAYKANHNGNDPIICAIHAGVECGMIFEKLPYLDMISLGPDVEDVHTVNETLYLKSCKTLLNTLLDMIKNLV